jgi:hypothetical protein
VLQVADSVDAPEQARPPLEGAGLLQSRVRDRVPPPQVRLHVPHADQAPQLPLTVGEGKCLHLGLVLLC